MVPDQDLVVSYILTTAPLASDIMLMVLSNALSFRAGRYPLEAIS